MQKIATDLVAKREIDNLIVINPNYLSLLD